MLLKVSMLPTKRPASTARMDSERVAGPVSLPATLLRLLAYQGSRQPQAWDPRAEHQLDLLLLAWSIPWTQIGELARRVTVCIPQAVLCRSFAERRLEIGRVTLALRLSSCHHYCVKGVK